MKISIAMWCGLMLLCSTHSVSALSNNPCPRIALIRNLHVESFYTDAKHSIPDMAALSVRNEKLGPLRTLRDRLVQAADLAMEGNTSRLPCAIDSLNEWVRAKALEADSTSGETVYSKTRFIFPMAVGLLKIKSSRVEADLMPAQLWIGRLAHRNVAEFPRYQQAKNGLYFWTGSMAAAVAVLNNDDELRAYALRVLDDAVAQIRDDGSMLLAMSRGQRALIYHLSSLNAIIAMRRYIGQCTSLACFGDGELKLVHFVARGIQDPSMFEADTGEAQEMVETRSLNLLCHGIDFGVHTTARSQACKSAVPVDYLLGGRAH